MFHHDLAELRNNNLLRYIRGRASSQGPKIEMDGREVINFASNDYLGLANHSELMKAACAAMESFGLGGGASRLLGGGTTLHRDLEERVACFKGTEAALIFNSGYAANTGIIPAIAGNGDAIFSDELNHASIIDGCRLSRARTLVYRHRNVSHLAELMKREYPTFLGKGGKPVVVTDTVFSMDGDMAPLREIAELCGEYNALLYTDDAHGTGVIGGGKGALAHFGIVPEPWIIQTGTFSKALGSFGAFVAGSRDVIEWITNCARSFIFSTALPACIVAASMRAMELLERRRDLVERLWRNRERLVSALREIGFRSGQSETPIIPLKIGNIEDTLAASKGLYDRGIYVPAIRPPAVKEPILRITVTAAHSEEDIDSLVQALRGLRK